MGWIEVGVSMILACSVKLPSIRSAQFMNSSLASIYQEHGFAVVPDCLDSATVERLIHLTESARERNEAAESVSNSSGVYALRNLVDVVPEVAELALNLNVAALVEAVLRADAFLVRSTLFDKTDGANWECSGIRICRSLSKSDMKLRAIMHGLEKPGSSVFSLL